jgi:chemotaxis protein methyltransferase CheR
VDDVLKRVQILGTDIDRASLAAAELARYHEPAFAETPPGVADHFFPRINEMRVVRPELRAITQFERRDLLHQSSPPGKFHLITCRNVVIYFSREAQESLFTMFHSALAPGGYLVLGRVETLLGRPRTLFRPVDLRERIFRRAG